LSWRERRDGRERRECSERRDKRLGAVAVWERWGAGVEYHFQEI